VCALNSHSPCGIPHIPSSTIDFAHRSPNRNVAAAARRGGSAYRRTDALAGGVLSLEGWSRRLAVFLAECLVWGFVGDEALGSGPARKEEHWQQEP